MVPTSTCRARCGTCSGPPDVATPTRSPGRGRSRPRPRPARRRSGRSGCAFPFSTQSRRPRPSRSSSGAGAKSRVMVRLTISRVPTSIAPSWSRYSSAPYQNTPSFIGPPAEIAYCWRSNGGSGFERSNVAGKPWSESSRKKMPPSPLELARARARNDVDRGGRGASELGGIARRCHLEFLDGILGKILQRAADHIVVVVGAVDRHGAAASKLPRRRDQDRIGLGRIEVRRQGVARYEQGQLEKVATIERQRGNLALPDDSIDGRRHRIHALRRIRFVNRDHFAHAGDGERDVEVARLPDGNRHVLEQLRRKASGGDLHADQAGRQLRDGKSSLRIRGRRAFGAGGLDGDGDRGAGHDGGLRVGHAAAE